MKNIFPTFRRVLTVSQRLGIGAWLRRVLDGWQRSPVVRFCLLVWLILLCATPLRRLATLTYLPDNFYPAWMRSDDYYDEDEYEEETPAWMHTEDSEGEDAAIVLSKNDRMALIAQAEDRPNGYDNLVRRFPDDAVIVAGYLRGRVALYGIGNRQPLYAGRRFPIDKKTLPTDWNTSIAIARRALKLEPQNAFFDMALTTLLVAVGRDQEAYRVLESGSRKPIFDDHALDAAQLQLGGKERSRTLNTEEKSYFALTAGYGNHLYRMSYCLEMLSWLTWRDEQNSNAASSDAASFKVRSLQRRAAVARMAAKSMVGRQASSYLSMMGNRQIINAWRTSLQSRPTYLSRRLFSNANSTLAQAFAVRARTLQQPAIAAETLRIMEVNEDFYNSRQRSSDMDFFLGGLQALAALRWLAKAQIVLCVALYLALSLFVLKTGKDKFSVPAPRKIALDATIYAFVALALMLSHIYRFGEFRASDTILWRPWFSAAPFALSLWAHWKMSQPQAQLSRHSWLGERANEYSKLPPLRKIYMFCVLALALQIALFWVVITFYMLRGRFFVTIPLPNRPTPLLWGINPSFNLLALLALVALLTTHFVVSWRWLASREERRFTFPILRSFRRTTGMFVAGAHFLFLLSVLASLPAQSSVNQRLESYWRQGHIWLATGFTSREWIERIDGAPSSTRFTTNTTPEQLAPRATGQR